MRTTPPKVLFLDIETAPAIGYFWGKTFQTDIIKVIRPMFLLSFAYQWQDENKINYIGLPDCTPHYKSNLENDFFLLKKLHALLDEADVVIAHNGDRFDLPSIQARFIRYNMKPPSPYKTIDTYLVCKREFKIESNRLNFVATFLGIGSKIPHTGLDLWERCMAGIEAAWEVMAKYNKHDIYLLREVYNIIRPYIKNHPDLSTYDFKVNRICPTCRSPHVVIRGYGVNAKSQYVQFQCRDCGKYHKGPNITRKQVGREQGKYVPKV